MTAVRAFETQAAKCQMMSNLRASRALNPSQSPPTVSPLLMKAVLPTRLGPISSLRMGEISVPSGRSPVRVFATSLNPVDYKIDAQDMRVGLSPTC